MKAKYSPWGAIESEREIATGITEINTARHGGFKLDRKRNLRIPECMRTVGGWYEEDCQWAIVALTFPEAFPTLIDFAISTMKSNYPDQYTTITGNPVAVEESHVLRQRAYKESVKGKYLVVSAMGDWHEKVPSGMVGVIACIDGRNENGMFSNPLNYFMVPAVEYNSKMILDGYPQVESL